MVQGPLDFAPLWVLFLFTLAFVMISLESGFALGRRRADLTDPESQPSVGAMANASLALLAFMLAFTFGFAATRFETRRTLLLDEVNAIGTPWRRAATLPEPERSGARALLREYVDVRLEAVRSGEVDAAIERSEALQARLWESAAALAQRSPGSIAVGLYLQTLNEAIDLHTKRISEGLRVRIQPVVWGVLLGVTVLAMAQLGYQAGLAGGRRPLSVPAFALSFALVMYLIADLDRPQAGWIRVSQQPMLDLQRSMSEPPPAAASR
jgi:hypothetical protein